MKGFVLGLFVGATVVSASAAAAQQVTTATRESRSVLARYAMVARGSQTIPAGTVSRGSVLILHGDLDVYGDVAGAATTIGGDIIVHQGGRIRGAAVAMLGKVRNDGGTILGVIKEAGPRGTGVRIGYGMRPRTTIGSLKSAIGWLIALLLLGVWALFYAGDQLKRVVGTISNDAGKSLLAGILGGLSTIPALVALVILMAITIIGIVFIPIGVAGFFVVVGGIGILGFLAVAQVTGIAISGESKATETQAGNELRYLVSGILAFSALWIVAAAFTWMPVVGTLLRVLAASVTFVAVMTGFGAVIISFWRQRQERKEPVAA
ncbi:MAG: hypothetical protein M3Z17_10585 [Gemmatimonadota bacterium]|nr:hypothetical protein [Gemmatimonadota bacterium]